MNEEAKNIRAQHFTDILHRNRAERVVQTLIEKIDAIRYVKEWAEEANVSKEWLAKEMKATFNKPPKMILREVRYEIIVVLVIKKGAEVTSLTVALESGVGETSDALYKFLQRHYNTSFSELKDNIWNNELDLSFSWLNWKELFYFYEYMNWRQNYRNGL